MVKVSKIGICAGHYNGANRIPSRFANTEALKGYSEGTAMFNLAKRISETYSQIYNARTEAGTAKPWHPNFPERAKRLAVAKCDYAFELHTNWSMKNDTTPNRGIFVVITSLCYEDGKDQEKRAAEEVSLATRLWKPLADALGLKLSIRQKKGGGNWDYYSFINYCKKRGIAHPMIIEHGYHPDYAENTEEYTRKIVEYYQEVMRLTGVDSTPGGGGEKPNPADLPYLSKKICSGGKFKEYVRTAQKLLVNKGFKMPKSTLKNGQMDGIFGSETESVTRAFQKKVFPSSPKEWDGIIGPKTWAELLK